MKIASLTIVRNMETTIAATLKSLEWVETILIVDDGSSDGTVDIIKSFPKSNILLEHRKSETHMFLDGELAVRNEAISRAFQITDADAVILLDADEIISSDLKAIIEQNLPAPYSGIAFSCFHLFDFERHLRLFETAWNGTSLIDPHVRVITRDYKYEMGHYDSCKHPFINFRNDTLCLDSPLHFHLKYWFKSSALNTSFPWLPDKITPINSDVVHPLPFPLPQDIRTLIDNIRW